MNALTLAIYGFGHFGKSLLWMSSVLVFAFYLTEVAGFPPTRMGWVLSLSLLVNAASDYAIGRGLGHRVTSIRAATRLQAAGSCLAGLCFILFAQTATLPPEGRTLYAIVTLILFRLGYSLYDVPQNAMLGLVAGSDSDRSQISAARYAAAGCANIVVTLCLSIWIVQVDADRRESVFALMATVFAAIAVGSALLVTAHFAARRPQAIAAAQPRPQPQVASARHLPTALAFGSILIFSTLMPVFSELKVYFAAFALPQDHSAVAFLLCSATGQILAQPIWAAIGRRRSLLSLYRLAALTVIAAGITFGLAATAGLPWILVAAVLFGATSSGLLMAIWAIMGHVAGANPERSLTRFGQFTACSKLAQAASVMAIGQILALGEYRSGAVSSVIAAMTGAVVLTGALCLMVSLLVAKRREGRSAAPVPG